MAVEAGLGGPVAPPVYVERSVICFPDAKTIVIPLAVVDFDAEVEVHDFALELYRSHCGAGARRRV